MAEVIWSIKHEFARTLEDVLARRVRLLFLDARAAMEAAPMVAKIMAKELDKDNNWIKSQETQFRSLAKNYILT